MEKKVTGDAIWTNFGTRLTKAYNNFLDTDNLIIKDSSSFNQANLAEAVLNTMQFAQKEHPTINKNEGNGKNIPPTMSTRGQSLIILLVKNANTVNIRDDKILKNSRI